MRTRESRRGVRSRWGRGAQRLEGGNRGEGIEKGNEMGAEEGKPKQNWVNRRGTRGILSGAGVRCQNTALTTSTLRSVGRGKSPAWKE